MIGGRVDDLRRHGETLWRSVETDGGEEGDEDHAETPPRRTSAFEDHGYQSDRPLTCDHVLREALSRPQ